MRAALHHALAGVIALAFPVVAHAQGDAEAPPPADPRDEPAPQAPVGVSDPDLSPVARAAREVGSLREALDLVTSRASERAVATLEIERAEGLRRQALGAALPTLAATGTLTHHFIRTEVAQVDPASGAIVRQELPRTPTAIAQLTATQPILAPRVWHAIGTEGHRVELARLSAVSSDRDLVIAVARAVVAVVTAERVAEVHRVSLRGSLEKLELTRRARALGTSTELDVVRAEQDVAVARANLVSGDEAVTRSREGLGLVLGSSEAVGVGPGLSIESLWRGIRAACSSGAPAERPDVAVARKEVEMAERDVTDADLRYLPTADVSSTLAYANEDFANRRSYAWSIQGTVTLPIWDGGARYGARRAAAAAARQGRSRADAALRDAELSSAQARRSIQVATRARDVAREARRLAAETDRLSEIAFAAGAGTSFDLVEAGRRLRESEVDLAVREVEVAAARIESHLASSRCAF